MYYLSVKVIQYTYIVIFGTVHSSKYSVNMLNFLSQITYTITVLGQWDSKYRANMLNYLPQITLLQYWDSVYNSKYTFREYVELSPTD